MLLKGITSGDNPPTDINVIIEIPMHSDPVKYEIDQNSGIIHVDRINATPMYYPANYGFIPATLAGDGDPLDVMVICPYPLLVSSVINARPIGVLLMEDEKGQDEKIIAVPSSHVSKHYDNIQDVSQLPEIYVQEIKHFFEHYKDLEQGKWVRVDKIARKEVAQTIIIKSLQT